MVGKITVNIDREKAVEDLPELINNISELSELIPEWNRIEAKKLEEKIYKQISQLIHVNQRA